MSVWTKTNTKIVGGKVIITHSTVVHMRRRITNVFHRAINGLYQQDREAQRQYIEHCVTSTTAEAKAIAERRADRQATGRYGSSGIRMTKHAKRMRAAELERRRNQEGYDASWDR